MTDLSILEATHRIIDRVFVHATGSTEPGFHSTTATIEAENNLMMFGIRIGDDQTAEDWEYNLMRTVDTGTGYTEKGIYVKIIKQSIHNRCDIFVGVDEEKGLFLENAIPIEKPLRPNLFHLIAVYHEVDLDYIIVDGIPYAAIASTRTLDAPDSVGLEFFVDKNGTAPTISIANFVMTPLGNLYTWVPDSLKHRFWRMATLDNSLSYLGRDLYRVTEHLGDISSLNSDGTENINFGFYLSGLLFEDTGADPDYKYLISEIDTIPNRTQHLYKLGSGLTVEEKVPILGLVDLDPIIPTPEGDLNVDDEAVEGEIPVFDQDYDAETKPKVMEERDFLGTYNSGTSFKKVEFDRINTISRYVSNYYSDRDSQDPFFYKEYNSIVLNNFFDGIQVEIDDTIPVGTTYICSIGNQCLDTTNGGFPYNEIVVTNSGSWTLYTGRLINYVYVDSVTKDVSVPSRFTFWSKLLLSFTNDGTTNKCYITLIPDRTTFDEDAYA